MTYPKLPGLTWDGTLYQNDVSPSPKNGQKTG